MKAAEKIAGIAGYMLDAEALDDVGHVVRAAGPLDDIYFGAIAPFRGGIWRRRKSARPGEAARCAFTSTGEPAAVAPTRLAAFSKPRLLTVEALSRFDTASSRTAAIHRSPMTAKCRVLPMHVNRMVLVAVSPFAKTGLAAVSSPRNPFPNAYAHRIGLSKLYARPFN
jgi:hypothetical protein